jgi:hypothetical protein
LSDVWYLKEHDDLTFSGAESNCRTLGGQLATVPDKASNDALYKITGNI